MTLILITIAYAVIMTAVGAWPAVLIGRRQPLLALLAPVYGFALAAGVLTGLSVVMTMRTAAFAVLLPLAVISAVGATVSLRRSGVPVRRIDAAIAAGLVVLGCMVALAAPLRAGSEGPMALGVLDSLGYTATDIWLRDKQSDAQPASDPTDLRDGVGWFYVIEPQRIGVSAVNAAVGSLLRTGPDRTFQAMLTLLFAMVSLVAFVLARMLRAPPVAAAMGAAFALSAAVLSLVADTTTANLAALSLYPALLVVSAWGAAHRDWRAIPVAGLLAAGCMAVYPELAPPFLAAAAVGAVALAYRAWRRGVLLDWLADAISGTLGALAIAVALTPDGAHRALAYLASFVDRPVDALSDLPPRFLSLEDIGAWAFGTLHLYQLQWFDAMSQPKQAVAIILPVLLVVVVIVGIVQRRLSTWVLILVPVLVSAVLARSAYGRFQGGECEYCAWKSLTFALPFLAAGVAVGLGRALAGWRRGSARTAAAVAATGVVVAGLAGVAYGDAKLTSGLINSPNAYTNDLRAITAATSRVNQGIAVEGLQARGSDILDLGLVALLAARDGRRPPVFDPGSTGVAYITPAKPPRLAYWDPAYGAVLTAFPGIDTGRERVASSGRYALDIRNPVDAVISRTGVAIDPADGERAIAWVTSPFQVTVTREPDTPTALTFSLTRPPKSRATIVVTQDGVPVPVVRSGGGTRVCAAIAAGSGVAVVDVQPIIGAGGSPPGRARITDPVPAPPKALGLAGLRAQAGPCTAAATTPEALPPAYRGSGWWAPEPGAPGNRDFAWMRPGSGQVLVGDAGAPRPAVQVRFFVTSFSVPRTVTARLAGRAIGTFTASSTGWSEVRLDVPAGTVIASISLSPDPGAQRVSADPAGDTRRISIGVTSPEALQPGG